MTWPPLDWLVCRTDVLHAGWLGPSYARAFRPAGVILRATMDTPGHVASHLARNLTALRHARALTQDTLAKSAGVPRSTIANLESGDGNPSLAVLVKVAEALLTSIDELLASPRAKVRRWIAKDLSSRTRGRGVTTRALVPEPVPEEMMELMEFAPDA